MTDPDETQSEIERLNPQDLLIAEYNYIAQAAFQTNEDRARYVSFYILSVGSLIAAIFSSQLDANTTPAVNWGFAFLFLSIGAVGLLTILQLVQLRLAWFDSVKAMNQLKRYYFDRTRKSASYADAFRWNDSSLPPLFKLRSISFLTTVQVALLAGINAGSAIMWIGFANQEWWWVLSISGGFLYAGSLLVVYWMMVAPTSMADAVDPVIDVATEEATGEATETKIPN